MLSLNLAFATFGQIIGKTFQSYYFSLSNAGLLVAGPLMFYFSRKFPTKLLRNKFDKLLFRSFICLAFFEMWAFLIDQYHFPTFSYYDVYHYNESDKLTVVREASKSLVIFLLVQGLVFFKRRAIGPIESAYLKFIKATKRINYAEIKDKTELQDMKKQIFNILTPYKKVACFDLVFTLELLIFILFFLVYELCYTSTDGFDYLPMVLLGFHFFNMWSLKFFPFMGVNSQTWPKFFIALYILLLSVVELAVPCALTVAEPGFFDEHDTSLPISVLYGFKKFNQVLCIVALRAVAKNPLKYIKLYPGFMLVNSLSFGYFYFKAPFTIIALCVELLTILLLIAPELKGWYRESKGRKACLYSTNNRDLSSRVNTLFFSLGYLCLQVCIFESILGGYYDYVTLYGLLALALIFFYYEFTRLIFLPNFQFATLIEEETKQVMQVDYDKLAKTAEWSQKLNDDSLEEDSQEESQQLERNTIVNANSLFSPNEFQDIFTEKRKTSKFERKQTIRDREKKDVLITVMKHYTFLEYDLGELQLSSKIKQEMKNFSKQVEKLPLGMSSFLLFITTVLVIISFIFFQQFNDIEGFQGSVILFCAFFLELTMIVYFFTLKQRHKYGPYSKSVFGITVIWVWILAIMPYFCIFPVLLTVFDRVHYTLGLEITRLAIATYFILTLILTVSVYAAIAHKRISLHNKELFLIETTNALIEILKSEKALGDKHLLRKSVEACLGVIKNFKEKELIESEEIMVGIMEMSSPVIIELKNRLKYVIDQIVKIRNIEKIQKLIEKYSVELIGKDQKVKSLIEIDEKKRLASFEKELNSRKKAIQRRKTILKKMEKQRENCSKLCKSLVQKVEIEKRRKKEKKEEKQKLIINEVIKEDEQKELEDVPKEDSKEKQNERPALERQNSTANILKKYKKSRENFRLPINRGVPKLDSDMLTYIQEEQSEFMNSQLMLESQRILSPRLGSMATSLDGAPRVLGTYKEKREERAQTQNQKQLPQTPEKEYVIEEVASEFGKSSAKISPDIKERNSQLRFLQKEEEDQNILLSDEEKSGENRAPFSDSLQSDYQDDDVDISSPGLKVNEVSLTKENRDNQEDEKESEKESEKSFDDENSQNRQHLDSFVSLIQGKKRKIRDLRKFKLGEENEAPSPIHFGILYSMMYSEPKCQEYFYKLLFNCFADVEDNEGEYVSPESLAQISRIIRTDFANKLMQAITKNEKDYDFFEFREMLTTKLCQEITYNVYDHWHLKGAILKELFRQTQRRYPEIFFSAKFAGKLIMIHRLKEIEEEEFKEVEDQRLSDKEEEDEKSQHDEEEEKAISEGSSSDEEPEEEEQIPPEEEKKEQAEEIQVEETPILQGELAPRPRRKEPSCAGCKNKVRDCKERMTECNRRCYQRLAYCCRRMKQNNKDCRTKAKKDLKRWKECTLGCFQGIASCFNNCIVKMTQRCRLSEQFKELIENREDELEKDEQNLEGRVSEVLKQKHFGYRKRYPPCEQTPSFPQDFAPISQKVLQLEFQSQSIKCSCKNNRGAILFRIIEFFIMSSFGIFGFFYSRLRLSDNGMHQGGEYIQPSSDYISTINFIVYCICCFVALFAALLGFIYRKKILEGQMKNLTKQIKKSKTIKGADKKSIAGEEASEPQEPKESKCSQCQTKFITLYLSLIIVVFNPVIVKNLLRTFMCNEQEYNSDIFINACYSPRHYALILFSFICLLIFYPIATIIYPGIVYSKFSRNSKKSAELTYKPTFMLTLSGYKLLIGALTPILSKDQIVVSLRVNLNSLMLYGLLWMTIQSSPCVAINAQKAHITGFTILAIISTSCAAALAAYKPQSIWQIIFFLFTLAGLVFLMIKIIKLKAKKKKNTNEGLLKRKMSFIHVNN